MMWPCVSRQFTKTFIVESSSPMVVLASLLEAVIYGKVEIVPAFLTDPPWWSVTQPCPAWPWWGRTGAQS